MKIIQVHNYYKQAGGEDVVVKAELDLLRSHGEDVITYYKTNDDISGFASQLSTCIKTLWNQKSYKELRKLLKDEKPDIVHCHNTFPLISPSIYWACSKEKVPVIQTLHNYRLLCINSSLFRKNAQGESNICELCIGKKIKLAGIKYKCYRESRAGSTVLAAMILLHLMLGTWKNKVTKYVVLTEFQKKIFSEAFSNQGQNIKSKISIKPNFVDTDDCSFKEREQSNYVLYVGRISFEKGCHIALNGFKKYLDKYKDKDLKFKIVGDGSERENLETSAKKLDLADKVEFTGKVSRQDVAGYISQAKCLIFSSISYETFGLTIIEAFQNSCPVIAGNIESVKSIIDDNINGLLYGAHSPEDLADKLYTIITDQTKREKMISRAKQDVIEKYTKTANYKRLIEIYNEAML